MTLDTSIWEWWRVWWLWWWRDQILLVLFLPVKEGGMRDLKVFSIVLQVWSQSFSMYQPSNAHCASSLLPFQCKMQLKISTLYPPFPMRLLLVKSCSWSCYSHICCHFSSNSMSVHHFGYPSFVTPHIKHLQRPTLRWWCSPSPSSQLRKLGFRLEDALCMSTHYIDSNTKSKPTFFNSNLTFVL